MGEAQNRMNFPEFATAHGLIIDHIIEGRWVRTKTTDKRTHRNGSYKYLGDVAWVQNHATMEHVAMWHPDGTVEKIDRARMRQIDRERKAQQEFAWAAARKVASDMITRSSLGVHPYLVTKGFAQEKGFVLDGELLIPMRDIHDYKRVNSLQRIAADGSKKFLGGGKAQGSVFKLGFDHAKERWLCEGYATGLSVRAALRDIRRDAQVVVCFSAGNMVHVAPMVKRPAFVMADKDASQTGEKAATATQLPWVMPDKGDANDIHQERGLRALVKVIVSG